MKRLFLFISLCLASLLPLATKAVTLPDEFPRIGNYFLDPNISDSEATQLAQWDIVIVGFETHYTSPNAFTIMKNLNPDIIILAYVTSEEVPEKHLLETDVNSPIYQLYHQLNEHDDWYLKNSSGAYVNFWPDTRMLDVTGQWSTVLPNYMATNIVNTNQNHWDGIFYDNCFNDVSWVDSTITVSDSQWKDRMTTIMQNTREQLPKKIILCNSNGKFYSYINGRLIEAFPSDNDGGWAGPMSKDFSVLAEGKPPSIVIVNSVQDANDNNIYQQMRYNLTSTLLGDGFASFDQSVSQHSSLSWYDEYSVALGKPLGDPYNVATNQGPNPAQWSKGVWRRNFERGIVLINSADTEQRVVLENGFEKILGKQDPIVNDGSVVGSVKIPAHDGIILQGRIAQVVDDPYVNGTFAKVFSARGKKKRNSFFTYNSAYAGSDVVVSVSDINTVFVAGQTNVTVYKNDVQVAQFAPYGTNFHGGVNITVERLDGPKKPYRIITGTQSGGAQVRIFSTRGKLINPGCFPYGTGFHGGINVAVANVLPKSAKKEIVVGAGQGGGPQVIVLNNRCQTTGRSWFAYEQSSRSGVWVAAGDVNNDGKDDIVTIPGQGAAPLIKTFTGRGKKLAKSFYAFTQTNHSGAQVAISDIDGDSLNELIAMSFSIFNQ
jgi:hypothetical protein